MTRTSQDFCPSAGCRIAGNINKPDSSEMMNSLHAGSMAVIMHLQSRIEYLETEMCSKTNKPMDYERLVFPKSHSSQAKVLPDSCEFRALRAGTLVLVNHMQSKIRALETELCALRQKNLISTMNNVKITDSQMNKIVAKIEPENPSPLNLVEGPVENNESRQSVNSQMDSESEANGVESCPEGNTSMTVQSGHECYKLSPPAGNIIAADPTGFLSIHSQTDKKSSDSAVELIHKNNSVISLQMTNEICLPGDSQMDNSGLSFTTQESPDVQNNKPGNHKQKPPSGRNIFSTCSTDELRCWHDENPEVTINAVNPVPSSRDPTSVPPGDDCRKISRCPGCKIKHFGTQQACVQLTRKNTHRSQVQVKGHKSQRPQSPTKRMLRYGQSCDQTGESHASLVVGHAICPPPRMAGN